MSRWWTPRAISAHVTLAVCEPGFAALAWWQVDRAVGGNSLSWLYVFEWPFFGAYAAYLWWRIVHDQAPAGRSSVELVPALEATAGLGPATSPVPAAGTPELPAQPAPREQLTEVADEDPELAAYNRYLARLAAEDAPKRW